MNKYVKTAIWIGVLIILVTHPQIINHVMNSLSVFMANVHT